MLHSTLVAALLLLSTSTALPLEKRIAQVIVEATRDWEQACLAAGGGQKCNPLSIDAFSALLAGADVCGQQNAADNMIDLAKQLNNDPEMLRLTQLYRQQARNSPDSLSTLYCQQGPRNSELDGLFNCQFAGTNPTLFTGKVDVGAPGTIPFGLSQPLSPPGSCPALNTPIPDGQQLNRIVSDARVGGGSGGQKPQPPANKPPPPNDDKKTPPAETAPPPPPPAAPAPPPPSGDKPFTLSNGQVAQSLNAKFATLTGDSPCDAGDQACLDDGFAQCVGGKFVVSPCAGGTICFALPLVNSAGVSLACTTQGDAEARIAATGAQGGITGGGAAAPAPPANNDDEKATPAPAPPPPVANTPPPPANNGNKSFALENGRKAQELNKKFAGLTASSPCDAGEIGCINGGFAQCVGGSFVVTGCAGGTICAALPLVNSPGTSVTCTTDADAAARISATGATGGISG